jgi:hypothetical protein
VAAKRGDNFAFAYVAEIASVMKHPTKLRSLMAVGRAKNSIAPVDIAREIEVPHSDVAYHVRDLARIGAVELAGVEPVRGATKHLYVISPFGEEVLTWARKMERHGRKRERERAADAEAD